MRLIGLTGGVATGKSLVAQLFAIRGAAVLSADAVARDLTSPGAPLVGRIADVFGPSVARDGTLDRSALGSLVFGDPEARRKLEAIVHPPVLAALHDAIGALRNRKPQPEVVVVEVPLLYEVGIEGWFDEVIVVTAPESDQIKRMRERDGLDEASARARIAAQMPLAAKAARADHVISNEGTVEDVERQVDAMMEKRCA